MAPVALVRTFQWFKANLPKLENLLHRFFDGAIVKIQFKDTEGNFSTPKECFSVQIEAIKTAVELLISGEIVDYVAHTVASLLKYVRIGYINKMYSVRPKSKHFGVKIWAHQSSKNGRLILLNFTGLELRRSIRLIRLYCQTNQRQCTHGLRQISFLASILATVRAVLFEKQAEPILDPVA